MKNTIKLNLIGLTALCSLTVSAYAETKPSASDTWSQTQTLNTQPSIFDAKVSSNPVSPLGSIAVNPDAKIGEEPNQLLPIQQPNNPQVKCKFAQSHRNMTLKEKSFRFFGQNEDIRLKEIRIESIIIQDLVNNPLGMIRDVVLEDSYGCIYYMPKSDEASALILSDTLYNAIINSDIETIFYIRKCSADSSACEVALTTRQYSIRP